MEAAEAIAKSNGKKRMELSFGHGDLFSGIEKSGVTS